MKTRLIAFTLLAWFAAAGAAGILGWNDIWGTGSALVDYLIPFPTTGGALHVPSLAASLLLIAARQRGDFPLAAVARPLLLGFALAGALLLAQDENPLGLFLLVDGLVAQIFLDGASLRPLPGGVATAIAVTLLPGLALWAYTHAVTTRYQGDLAPMGSRPGPERGDEEVAVFSRIGVDRARLEAAVAAEPYLALPPEHHVDAEDQAVYFFDDEGAARELRRSAIRQTLCRYEDGTAQRWSSGEADCFSGHVSFSELWQAATAATDVTLSMPVRTYLALRETCAGIASGPQHAGSDVAARRACATLPGLREQVLAADIGAVERALIE